MSLKQEQAAGPETFRTYRVIKDPYPTECCQPLSEIAYQPTYAVLCHDPLNGSCEIITDLFSTQEEAESAIVEFVAFDREEASQAEYA